MPLRDRVERFSDWLRRLFRRAPPPPRPGYLETGSKWSWRGWLAHMPWVAPSRDYVLYLPDNYNPRRAYPLVVWLHGCRQSPEDFAAATRIVAEANTHNVLVLLPRQTRSANADGCWNWFDSATGAGYGEAAIVMAQIMEVRRRHRLDRRRIFLAGLSSGGALAAVLVVRHPERFAAVAIHSGVPCGAATTAWTAQEVLRSGPNRQVERIALAARHRAPARALPVPALIICGSEDKRVHEANARRLVTQLLALNGDPRALAADTALPPADRVQRFEATDTAHAYELHDYLEAGRNLVQYVLIAGLAHAWSGGDEQFPYNDAKGPDATRIIFDFFDQRAKSGVRSLLARMLRRSP